MLKTPLWNEFDNINVAICDEYCDETLKKQSDMKLQSKTKLEDETKQYLYVSKEAKLNREIILHIFKWINDLRKKEHVEIGNFEINR